MAKTKEELSALKTELETFEKKVMELDEEELNHITGGMITFEPLRRLLKENTMTKYELLKKELLPAEVQRIPSHSQKRFNDSFTELLEQLQKNQEEQQTTKE